MSKETKSNPTNTSSKDAPASSIAKETAQGFRGVEVDPTPNENYTVAGVTSGAPTPETAAESAQEVRLATGVGLSAIEAANREKTARGEK